MRFNRICLILKKGTSQTPEVFMVYIFLFSAGEKEMCKFAFLHFWHSYQKHKALYSAWNGWNASLFSAPYSHKHFSPYITLQTVVTLITEQNETAGWSVQQADKDKEQLRRFHREHFNLSIFLVQWKPNWTGNFQVRHLKTDRWKCKQSGWQRFGRQHFKRSWNKGTLNS